MVLAIKQIAGDQAGASDVGQTITPIASTTASNYARIAAAAVPCNASVVATAEPSATTYDVVIDPNTYDYTKLMGLEFSLSVGAVTGSPPTGYVPQVYVKLLKALGSGAGYDLVIPLSANNPIASWINPAIVANMPNTTDDANGAAMSIGANQKILLPNSISNPITTITVTPDKYYATTISGTIEYLT